MKKLLTSIFGLFITSLALFAQQGLTCDNPLKIDCNKSFHWNKFNSHVPSKANYLPCAKDFQAVNDIWLELEISRGGELEFDIIADNNSHDLDFAIYDASLSCNALNALRCSAAVPLSSNKTGLTNLANDLTESEGNSKGQDGLISKLKVHRNQKLLIYVHNFDGTDGATIRFNNILSLPGTDHNFTVSQQPQPKDQLIYKLIGDLNTENVSWVFKQSNITTNRNGKGPHVISLKPTSPSYNVLIENTAGCEIELSDELTNSVKLPEAISIYPNPAFDNTILDLSQMDVDNIAHIDFYQSAKLLNQIQREKINSINLELETKFFPKGMIDVVVVKNDGQVLNSRFVKN